MRDTQSGAARQARRWATLAAFAVVSLMIAVTGGCRSLKEAVGVSVAPRSLRDVPAARMAFRLEPDISPDVLPEPFKTDAPEAMLAPVKSDFETRRAAERLVRTVTSPDGQRALALYETGETLEGDFRIDLYGADGMFVRNILPPEVAATFPQEVAWSPDGQQFAFIGVRNPSATPTPRNPADPDAPLPSVAADPTIAQPTPTIAPIIPAVQVFGTEQIYVADRDGFNIRPVTTRDGLIYFVFAWSPDSRALAALACKETEWNARRAENRTPAGRPRLVSVDAVERLLDDRLADAAPTWSPDGSKVAAAFDKTVAVYDVTGERPTAANIPLEQPLRTAAAAYDASKLSPGTKTGAGGEASQPTAPPTTAATTTGDPLSFNPVVRLAWLQPETLLVQTGFIRVYSNEPVTNYIRWHVLHLSPQAAVLSLRLHRPAGAPGNNHDTAPRLARRRHIRHRPTETGAA